MNIEQPRNIFFIGIGGIGMSALARYFKSTGKKVWGYDRTPTELTSQLVEEGIHVHFDDDVKNIPPEIIKYPVNSLIIYTPAIPPGHFQFTYFKENQYTIKKRSEILGMITRDKKTIAVSGTHGKTTVSAMIAHLLHHSQHGCNAFLGGIAKNYNSNLLLSANSNLMVVEADEFDRSFLQLSPDIAIITAIDTDHLDIYSKPAEIKKAFLSFTDKIKPGGTLIIKKGIGFTPGNKNIQVHTYSLHEEADYHAIKLVKEGDCYRVDIQTPDEVISDVKIGMPGEVNVENTVAAVAAAKIAGMPDSIIREAMPTFTGIARRFDYQVRTRDILYIDDYAHHPEEIRRFVLSVKKLYPGKKITGIFQPHLYSRTRDLADGFAQSLELLDEIVLTEIYPAREEPLEGVTSDLIFKKIKNPRKTLCLKNALPELVMNKKVNILLTMGAGDIDKMVKPLKETLMHKLEKESIR